MKKKWVITSAFLPLSFLSCSASSTKLILNYVYDGDTIYFKNKKGGRLFGIDAPELKVDNIPTENLQRFFALKSRNFLRNYISNKTLKIENLKKDKYGRFIIRLFADGVDVNMLLVQKGLAKVSYISNNKSSPFFSKNEIYMKKLYDTQHFAWKQSVGIWSVKSELKHIYRG